MQNNYVLFKYCRDLNLMVKYETFNLCYVGSNPTGLIRLNYYSFLHYYLMPSPFCIFLKKKKIIFFITVIS